MAKKVVTARVSRALLAQIEGFVEADKRRSTSSVVEAALKAYFAGQGPPPDAALRSAVGIFRRVRELEADAHEAEADLDQLITAANALLWDYLALVGGDYTALDQWSREGGDIPVSLCDPMAAVSALEATRKLLLARHKVETDQSVSREDVSGLFERFAEVVTDTLATILPDYLNQGQAREAQSRFLDLCRDGWTALGPGERLS